MIVNCVLDGACPYAFVAKKLDGSKAVFRYVGEPGKEEPTLSGLGMISSSGLSDVPAPNRNSVLPSSLIKVVNLLDVFKSFSR